MQTIKINEENVKKVLSDTLIRFTLDLKSDNVDIDYLIDIKLENLTFYKHLMLSQIIKINDIFIKIITHEMDLKKKDIINETKNEVQNINSSEFSFKLIDKINMCYESLIDIIFSKCLNKLYPLINTLNETCNKKEAEEKNNKIQKLLTHRTR